MVKIFVSMCGEGRGHATRVRSLIERMQGDYEFTLFAPGEAYDFLHACYRDAKHVRIEHVPGPTYHYVNSKLSLTKTTRGAVHFRALEYPAAVRKMVARIKKEQPDVILTDFEPILAEAARRCRCPYLSLTHQHFLFAYDLHFLPNPLRVKCEWIKRVIKLHYSTQSKTLISSFFCDEPKPSWKDRAVCLGPMISPEIREQKKGVAEGDYIVSYLRKRTSDAVVHQLVSSGQRIKLYGLGARPPQGKVTFHAIDPDRFVVDLVGCKAVVSAAGNQLLGECMYLGKPVLAVPEERHHEQLVNAHFLRRMKCGDFVTLETLRTHHVADFLQKLPEFRKHIAVTCRGRDGTDAAIEAMKDFIQNASYKSRK